MAEITARALTQADMILIAFYRVAGGTTDKVPYEELVLQAWGDFPEAFSLRNHKEHPDASDVHKKLYNGPLKEDSLVLSLGDKNFRLTNKGLKAAELLVAAVEKRPTEKRAEATRLGTDDEKYIKHVLQTRAFADWCSGKSDKLIDYDARQFFQFTTGTKVEDRRRKAENAKAAIAQAKALGVKGGDELQALAAFLTEKFGQLFKEI